MKPALLAAGVTIVLAVAGCASAPAPVGAGSTTAVPTTPAPATTASGPVTTTSIVDPTAAALAACHTFVKHYLAKPATASFTDTRVHTLSPGRVEDAGTVRSTDLTGASVRGLYTCVATERSDGSWDPVVAGGYLPVDVQNQGNGSPLATDTAPAGKDDQAQAVAACHKAVEIDLGRTYHFAGSPTYSGDAVTAMSPGKYDVHGQLDGTLTDGRAYQTGYDCTASRQNGSWGGEVQRYG